MKITIRGFLTLRKVMGDQSVLELKTGNLTLIDLSRGEVVSNGLKTVWFGFGTNKMGPRVGAPFLMMAVDGWKV
jgi:hypothetical protein